ncbi:site-specific integrase [Clostridium sp.]|uniref:tyrosine-type recombinase/integrase n=1 Tax=Clostridium sp. TaxID=1506 RepID=UPI002911BE0B|nr:site-specific integrase [Clostridium sp.]MDU3527072.1 site-specific integrase [Clostridium sp.]
MKKSTKKGNGEGSISKIEKNGKMVWKGTISIGYDENGKLKRKVFYGNTKIEVVDKIAEFKARQNLDDIPNDDKITFEEWFYNYLFQFRVHDMKPSTFDRYYGIYSNYVLNSQIGKKKLIDLRTIDFQKYYTALLKTKPVSTVKSINRYISTCINEAVRQGYISKNYTVNVRLPKADENETINVLSIDEQKRFVNYINTADVELKNFFILALGTGMRQGEIMGLKWKDINFKDRAIKITRSLKKVTFIDADGTRRSEYIEQTPKTKSSIREIPISESVYKCLKDQEKNQKLNKLYIDNSIYIESDYVFTDKIGNTIDKNKPNRHFRAILKELKINPIKFHSLRHTFATRLFEKDVPVKTVQALLGHKDINTTMNIYTHVMKEQKEKAINILDDII